MKITNTHIVGILAIITTILIYLMINKYTLIVVIILGFIFVLGIVYNLLKFSLRISGKNKRKHKNIKQFMESQK
jgi:hypothetical protein